MISFSRPWEKGHIGRCDTTRMERAFGPSRSSVARSRFRSASCRRPGRVPSIVIIRTFPSQSAYRRGQSLPSSRDKSGSLSFHWAWNCFCSISNSSKAEPSWFPGVTIKSIPASSNGFATTRLKAAHIWTRCSWSSIGCFWPATMSPALITRSGSRLTISSTAALTREWYLILP